MRCCRHGWEHFSAFDDAWARLGGPRVRVLNVSGPSSMRPDAHAGVGHSERAILEGFAEGVDCLHFLLPPGGPVDVWNVMLQVGMGGTPAFAAA